METLSKVLADMNDVVAQVNSMDSFKKLKKELAGAWEIGVESLLTQTKPDALNTFIAKYGGIRAALETWPPKLPASLSFVEKDTSDATRGAEFKAVEQFQEQIISNEGAVASLFEYADRMETWTSTDMKDTIVKRHKAMGEIKKTAGEAATVLAMIAATTAVLVTPKQGTKSSRCTKLQKHVNGRLHLSMNDLGKVLAAQMTKTIAGEAEADTTVALASSKPASTTSGLANKRTCSSDGGFAFKKIKM